MSGAGAAEQTGARGRARLAALVVEDERPLVRVLTAYLEREGFSVSAAYDGEQAVDAARRHEPDLILLDVMLPGIDGIEVCRRVRAFSDAYIVMLTARAEEVDKIVGLSTGADDYVTKPFSPGELMARVRAMLRRPRRSGRGDEVTVRTFGALTIDPPAREVHVRGRLVSLTPREFALLEALSSDPRVVFTRADLLERVWGGAWFGDEHVVDVHVANVRAKLGDDAQSPRYIRTIRGVGYRMGTGG